MVCSTSTGAFCGLVVIYHFLFVISLFPSLPQSWPTWLSDAGGIEVCWERRGWRGVGGGGWGGHTHWVCQVRQNDRQEARQEGRRDSPHEVPLFKWRDLEQPKVTGGGLLCCSDPLLRVAQNIACRWKMQKKFFHISRIQTFVQW